MADQPRCPDCAQLASALRDLVEDLLERARGADRAAALADAGFDVQADNMFRGRALAFRAAARAVEQLVTGENRQPGQIVKSGDRGDLTPKVGGHG